MSCFSTALRQSLKDLGWTQSKLGQKTGFLTPQINRYIRGHSAIELDSLERICRVLPPEQREKCVKGFLQDQIPPSFEDSVFVITSKHPKLKEEPIPWPSGVDNELKKTLRQLARLALKHTEVRDMLVSFERCLNI